MCSCVYFNLYVFLCFCFLCLIIPHSAYQSNCSSSSYCSLLFWLFLRVTLYVITAYRTIKNCYVWNTQKHLSALSVVTTEALPRTIRLKKSWRMQGSCVFVRSSDIDSRLKYVWSAFSNTSDVKEKWSMTLLLSNESHRHVTQGSPAEEKSDRCQILVPKDSAK